MRRSPMRQSISKPLFQIPMLKQFRRKLFPPLEGSIESLVQAKFIRNWSLLHEQLVRQSWTSAPIKVPQKAVRQSEQIQSQNPTSQEQFARAHKNVWQDLGPHVLQSHKRPKTLHETCKDKNRAVPQHSLLIQVNFNPGFKLNCFGASEQEETISVWTVHF